MSREATGAALRRRIEANDELNDNMRRRALATVDQVEALVGADWPIAMYATAHPLAECLHNCAPPAIATFIRIGEALNSLRDVDGWLKVAGRLNSDPDQAAGAIAELMVAERARSTGASMSFSPSNGRGGHADLVVVDDASELYIEVCVTQALPEAARRVENLEDRVLPLAKRMASNVALGGRYLREPSEAEIEPLGTHVAEFLRYVESSPGLHSASIPGLIELRAIRFDDPSYQDCVGQGLVGSFQGVVFSYAPFQKLIRTLQRKARQLPKGGSGLLVITPPSFLGQPPPTDDLVEALRHALRTMPEVVALALHWYQGAWPAKNESTVTTSGAYLVQTVVHPPLVERVLLIENPDALDRKTFKLARQVMLAD